MHIIAPLHVIKRHFYEWQLIILIYQLRSGLSVPISVTNKAYISYMSDLKPGPGSRYVASLLQLEPRQFNLFLATTSENQECVLCPVVRILQILSPRPANTALICSGASA